MSLANSSVITLNYGEHECFSCEIDARRIIASSRGPEPLAQLPEKIHESLAQPLEFPPLQQTVIPNDHVTLALDRNTPEGPALIAGVWQTFERVGIDPANVMIIQPTDLNEQQLIDPRCELPENIREQITWKIHEPSLKDSCAYLATSTTGERIYLAREVIEADVVVSIGSIGYDPLLGHRGTNSVFYPGLSTADALRKAQGQGHVELGPDDDRPLRQMIDEIAWLLGTQFTVQVIPSAGCGVARVLAGSIDFVFRQGKKILADHWLVELDDRPEIVLVAVDRDSQGHGWDQLGAALATARRLVARDGKIVVLSHLEAEPGIGVKAISRFESPGDAIRPLRAESPPDLIPATQLVNAVEWADVYLLSRLESDFVEDLFMIPVADESEVLRLLEQEATCAFIGSAQHVHGRVRLS